jgi:hypothetical protein
MLQGPVENTAYCLDDPAPEHMGEYSLWGRLLSLVEQDLDERRSRKLFVEVREESGPCRKEIGELSVEERRGLDPALRESVAERLLDRYLAGQGRVDLVEKRRTYTKKLGDLTPEDLPALVEADRCRTEEDRERAEFVRETQADLRRLVVLEGGKGDRPPAARATGPIGKTARGRRAAEPEMD